MNDTSTDDSSYGDFNATYSYNDDYSSSTPHTPPVCTDAMCVILATVNVIIFILGIAGNGLVIWITGIKMKKSVNTTWYLSLAVSDFLFCAFLPFSIVYSVKGSWLFGRSMCKFTSFILLLNLFSSIFLLVIISVDRCIVVMFPVWAQNNRTMSRASGMVVLAWIVSAALSSPAAVFRDIDLHSHDINLHLIHSHNTRCFYDYTCDDEHIVIVACRFILGFMIPFVIIISCYIVIMTKLKTNQMAKSKKPFKVMTMLIVVFFICWLPYHITNLLELNPKYKSIQFTGQRIGTTLASANSCLNPFLYAFMGKDFKKKCYMLLSKIENAMEEEGRSTTRATSFTNSVEGKLSTVV